MNSKDLIILLFQDVKRSKKLGTDIWMSILLGIHI